MHVSEAEIQKERVIAVVGNEGGGLRGKRCRQALEAACWLGRRGLLIASSKY